jgi:hypothetical protein
LHFTGYARHIVSQLVEMAGGHIQVKSEPGRGSVFQFTWSVETERNDKPPSLNAVGSIEPTETVSSLSGR